MDNAETGWERVAAAINARMAELPVSQKELADEAGVSVATIRKLQNATQGRYQRHVMARIAGALRWRPDGIERLLRGEDPGHGEPEPRRERTYRHPEIKHAIDQRMGELEIGFTDLLRIAQLRPAAYDNVRFGAIVDLDAEERIERVLQWPPGLITRIRHGEVRIDENGDVHGERIPDAKPSVLAPATASGDPSVLTEVLSDLREELRRQRESFDQLSERLGRVLGQEGGARAVEPVENAEGDA